MSSHPELRLRAVQPDDAAALCAIYNPYVRETTITFEDAELDATQMLERMRDITQSYPWLVAEHDAQVVGYAYASRWRARPAYARSCESTIYLARESCGRGWGKPLYLELLNQLRDSGMHAVVGCITLPNAASVALHEHCGFVKVEHFPEVGRKFDRWLDVGFWQCTF